MAQFKGRSNNSNRIWSSKLRLKTNEVVNHLGSLYQNVTGVNTEPGTSNDWVFAGLSNDNTLVHKIGDEIIDDKKTFNDKIISKNGIKSETVNKTLPVIELFNDELVDRSVFARFSNQSASFDIGMQDASGTMFQVKEGDTPYLNIDRTTGKMAVGKNSELPTKTLMVKDNSTGGDTTFAIQAGESQTEPLIQCYNYDNTEAFTVDKDSNVKYYKNLNKIIVISGDSFSNDVSPFGIDGDFPTYFLYKKETHDYQHVVKAVAGRTVSQMLANYNIDILPYARNYEHDERILMIYGGINDLFADRTASDIYDDLKDIWLNAKNNGFEVIAFRICSSTTLIGPQETQRIILNNLISSDLSLFDHLVYSDVLFPDPSNVLFFSDGTHLNTVGARYLGEHTYNVVYEKEFSIKAINSINLGYKDSLVSKRGLEYESDFSVDNTSNPRWLTDKAYVDNATGWEAVIDTAHTVGSPQTVAQGVTANLTNNKGTIFNSQLPTGVTTFFDSATSKITPQNENDFMTISFMFKAKNSNADGHFTVYIDIPTLGERFTSVHKFPKGANTEHGFDVDICHFVSAQFASNGGIIKIVADLGNLEIYDKQFRFCRVHRAN